MIIGIDISFWQKDFDFKSMEDNTDLKFCIVKCTDGLSVDPKFFRNASELIKTNLWFGAYVWYRSNMDGKAQAAYFVETAKKGFGEAFYSDKMLPLCLDFELDYGIKGQALLDRFLEFKREVERLSNRHVVVYTGKYFYMGSVSNIDCEELSRSALWHAAYPGGIPNKSTDHEKYMPKTTPSTALPWFKRGIREILWQSDGDRGLVMPDGTDVDFNRFDGDEEDLKRFISSCSDLNNTIYVPYTLSRPIDLQMLLIRLGYDLGSAGADGVIGSKTKTALMEFQVTNFLPPTGELNPDTEECLKQALYSL